MYQLLQKCLDFIFPPSNECLCVRNLQMTEVLTLYNKRDADGVRALSNFTDTKIRALIHEAKFRGNTKAFLLLNALFARHIEHAHQNIDMIIPIPLSSARMRTRGYNQVTEILRAGDSQIKKLIVLEILKRVRDTRPQTELARNERLLNMRDAFGVTHGEKISGKHVLIVDDVSTTGATLNTAKAALLPYKPASVTCVALAH